MNKLRRASLLEDDGLAAQIKVDKMCIRDRYIDGSIEWDHSVDGHFEQL